MGTKLSTDERRKLRVRRQLKKVANGRPRLSVYRSSKHIYAQIIDDTAGRTLAAASTKDKDYSGEKGGNVEAAGLSASRLPSVPSKPVSKTWSLIAGVTFITVG